MRAVIRLSPEFGGLPILGEEAGREGEAAAYQWLLDPIDGTVSYTRGIPTFGVIVAMEDAASQRALVGVLHFPYFGETYAAARGLGSWRQGQRLQVSGAADLRTALVSAPDAYQFSPHGTRRRARALVAGLRPSAGLYGLLGARPGGARRHRRRGRANAQRLGYPRLAGADRGGGRQTDHPAVGLRRRAGCDFRQPALVNQLADIVFKTEANKNAS